MSQQIDKRIILKIHQLVGEGITQVREMQRHIRIFVKMELFPNQELPPTTSRRYFPKMSKSYVQSIHNVKIFQVRSRKPGRKSERTASTAP